MHNISRILYQNFKSIGAQLPKLWVFERPLLQAGFLFLLDSRAEEQTVHDSKEGRVLRRQIQKDALDHLDESFSFYGPGIDDSVWV